MLTPERRYFQLNVFRKNLASVVGQAIRCQLVRGHSTAFFRKTLQQLTITHEFVLHNGAYGSGGSMSCSGGALLEHGPTGFPPTFY